MNKFAQIISLIAAFGLSTANASRVAVVDSGTYFEHNALKNQILVNEKETPRNRIDDDRNGKVDDIVGWNFVENFNQIFFPQHISRINPLVYKMMDVVAHMQAETATDADKTFWETYVTKLSVADKQTLVAHLNFYGQYAHSTHCSGIIAAQNPDAKIMSDRVFPDSVPEAYTHPSEQNGLVKAGWLGWATKYVYQLISAVQSALFLQIGNYHKEMNIDVANYSLGVPLQTIAKTILALQGISKPTDAQLQEETQKAYAQFIEGGRKWMAASPDTLYVIAAGNDGTNNDLLPTFPANVRMNNSITVAACGADGSMAKFSNYGKASVDLCAPGVAIVSSVPGPSKDQTLPMSGTSMAAPFVTGVASKIKDINPKLTGWMIKEILVGTVDRKDEFQEKLITAGIINPERAYAAAELSTMSTLTAAITRSRSTVRDRVWAPKPAAAAATAAKAGDKGRFPQMDEIARRLVF